MDPERMRAVCLSRCTLSIIYLCMYSTTAKDHVYMFRESSDRERPIETRNYARRLVC
jgi:hypothetical protein